MTSMTALGTRDCAAWTRQAANGATYGRFVAVDTPGATYQLVARVTRGRHLGGKLERMTVGGKTLDQLRPRPVHLPPVQQVGVGQDVRVVQVVVLGIQHL